MGWYGHPSGAKSFLVNYRAGKGGRKAPNKRVVVGRVGRVTPDRARRLAQEFLGRVAAGDDPAGERAEARALPTLGDACEDYIVSRHSRAAIADRGYRRYAALYLGDWLSRPERELMLPRSLTERLVNRARPDDVTEGYAADWTVGHGDEAVPQPVKPERRAARTPDGPVNDCSTRSVRR